MWVKGAPLFVSVVAQAMEEQRSRNPAPSRAPRRTVAALSCAATKRVQRPSPRQQETTVIYSIILILIVLWVIANIASYTLGGLIHILLVIAVIVFIVNLITGRRR
jgi:hypothetical protein